MWGTNPTLCTWFCDRPAMSRKTDSVCVCKDDARGLETKPSAAPVRVAHVKMTNAPGKPRRHSCQLSNGDHRYCSVSKSCTKIPRAWTGTHSRPSNLATETRDAWERCISGTVLTKNLDTALVFWTGVVIIAMTTGVSAKTTVSNNADARTCMDFASTAK